MRSQLGRVIGTLPCRNIHCIYCLGVTINKAGTPQTVVTYTHPTNWKKLFKISFQEKYLSIYLLPPPKLAQKYLVSVQT